MSFEPAVYASRGSNGHEDNESSAQNNSDEAPLDAPRGIERRVGEYPNGRFLLVNIHGALFHEDVRNIYEDISYASWLNAGVIRVFATDAQELVEWNGERVGRRIVQIAPALRAANMKLIVVLVNNHRQVPGEHPDSAGWMDGYHQLLLPFYQEHWRGAYLGHMRGLINSVVWGGAQDVIWGWELGNELHTPQSPMAVLSFIDAAAAEVRALDPGSRVLAGTMGTNHLEPGVRDSAVTRALYCHAQLDAYTLHTYDWRSRQEWGDMPIHWDLEYVVKKKCPGGRGLPVVVEELGTSRELPGEYGADQEQLRFDQELNQIRMVLQYKKVVGIGAWSAESPLVTDTSRFDNRRGLTSYGSDRLGGGSCYRLPDGAPYGARCMLERVLRELPKMP